jgi:hypothetical protein
MFLSLWTAHVFVALCFTLPIMAHGKGRVRWHRWELLAFVLPFTIWACLLFTNSHDKTLGDLGECVLLGPAIGLAALIRVLIGPREPQDLWPVLLMGLLSLTATGIYASIPALPE